MKTVITSLRYKLPLLAFSILAGAYSFAQDSTGGTSTTQSSSSESHTSSTAVTPVTDNAALWYMQPWAWVVGGLILVIILYFIFRGNNDSKSEVTRTVKSTTEVKND